MKKVLIGVLSLLVLTVSVGCRNSNNSQKQVTVEQPSQEVETQIETPKQEETKIQEIKIGDKITTKNMEIIINDISLTYDVLPDDTSGFYTHYAAEAGKVYICVDADVKNTAKQQLPCDELGEVFADYDDGYTYSSFVIVDDTTTGFTYANISSIDPLATQGIKWLIECPQEVEESDKSLFLEFEFDGEKLVHVIR